MTRKKRKGQGKGSNFERKMCKEFSLWWTKGERDDVFWRTSNSGGRATTRRKRSQSTFMQHGDIGFVDPIGKPLIDFMTIELKNGYGNETLFNALDAPRKGVNRKWMEWRHKAIRDSKENKSKWWTIIHQRTRRAPVMYIPLDMYKFLSRQHLHHYGKIMSKFKATFSIPLKGKVVCFPLRDFWKIDPRSLY